MEEPKKAKGLIHYYYGYGKGKTTAAVGLAIRASGSDKKVVIVQFLKNRPSCEIAPLEQIKNITVLRGQASNSFSLKMNELERKETTRIHNENLQKAINAVNNGECDLLVLDEAVDAYELNMLDKELFDNLVNNKPEALELVITGHLAQDWIIQKADYVTEMQKKKHPYDKGFIARKGIEF